MKKNRVAEHGVSVHAFSDPVHARASAAARRPAFITSLLIFTLLLASTRAWAAQGTQDLYLGYQAGSYENTQEYYEIPVTLGNPGFILVERVNVGAGTTTTTQTAGSGSYTLANGSLNVTGTTYVGYNGQGSFTQSGGAFTNGGDLVLAFGQGTSTTTDSDTGAYYQGYPVIRETVVGTSPASGTYTMTGGTLAVPGTTYVGYGGNGTFNQGLASNGGAQALAPGGTVTMGNLYLGYQAGTAQTSTAPQIIAANGVYNLYQGTLNVIGDTYVGYGGQGTFNLGQPVYDQASGPWLSPSASVANPISHQTTNLYVGGSSGTYDLFTGALTVSGNISIGYSSGNSASGAFNQGGYAVGTEYDSKGNWIGQQISPLTDGGSVSAKNLYLGVGPQTSGISVSGTYTLSTGSLTVSGAAYIGYSGSGTFTQGQASYNGTPVATKGSVFTTGDLYLGYQTSSSQGTTQAATGNYTLYEGKLVANNAYIGYGGSGTFTQGGPLVTWTYGAIGPTPQLYGNTSGGTFTTGNLYISGSDATTGSGTYNLYEGTLNATNTYIGYNNGTSFTINSNSFNQGGPLVSTAYDPTTLASTTHVYANTSGGTFTTTNLYLGGSDTTTGSGTYNLYEGKLNATNTYVGYSSPSLDLGWLGLNGSTFNQGDPLVAWNYDPTAGTSAPQAYATSGGTFTTQNLYIGGGDTTTGNGTYNLYEGTLNATNTYVGYNQGSSLVGSGGFTQGAPLVDWVYNQTTGASIPQVYATTSGGTFTTKNLYIGGSAKTVGYGTYNLDEGTLNATGNTYVGYSTPTNGVFLTPMSTISTLVTLYSTFNQGEPGVNITTDPVTGNPIVKVYSAPSGGTFTTQNLYIGGSDTTAGNGEYNLYEGKLTATAAYVGYNSGGSVTSNGIFNQGQPVIGWIYDQIVPTTSLVCATPSGGTFTTQNLYIGGSDKTIGNGTYNLYEGKLDASAGSIYVGYNGQGTFNQGQPVAYYPTGSTSSPSMYTPSGGSVTTANLYIGYNSGSSGAYYLYNGSLTTTGTTYVGYNGYGSFYQYGGSHTAGSIVVGTRGTYNYQGGTIAGNLQNNGALKIAAGMGSANTFGASISNNAGGTVRVTGAGSTTFTGAVVNNGPTSNNATRGLFSIEQTDAVFANAVTNNIGAIFRIEHSTVTFNGDVANYGDWVVDPSTITFTGNFINDGDISATSKDTFEFLGQPGSTQTFNLGGDNLAILSLIIGPGVTLDLTGGGSLTIGGITEESGASIVTSDDTTYTTSAVPIPGALWLLLPGLACAAGLRKKPK